MRLVAVALAIVAVLAVLAVVSLPRIERSLVFPAPAIAEMPHGELVRADGAVFLWRAPKKTNPVVVHFHGNAEQIADDEFMADLYEPLGVGFAGVEYPGYGLASGVPSEASILAAGRAALTHIAGMGIDRSRIVLSGQSLGTGVAMQLAAEGWGTRMLLLSPYTSLPAVAARLLPRVPTRLMRTRFDSLAVASRVTIPVRVIHGTDDEVIPYDIGAELSTALPNAKLITVQGAHHNDLWSYATVRAAALELAGGM